MRYPEFTWAGVVLAFCLGILAAHVLGCGGVSAPRATLATAAHVLDGIDLSESEIYREQAASCLDASETAEAYAECIHPHDRVVAAESAVYHALVAAEAAIDAEEAGHGGSPLDIIPCAADAIDELIDALRAIHIALPPTVVYAVNALRVIAPGRCHGG